MNYGWKPNVFAYWSMFMFQFVIHFPANSDLLEALGLSHSTHQCWQPVATGYSGISRQGISQPLTCQFNLRLVLLYFVYQNYKSRYRNTVIKYKEPTAAKGHKVWILEGLSIMQRSDLVPCECISFRWSATVLKISLGPHLPHHIVAIFCYFGFPVHCA